MTPGERGQGGDFSKGGAPSHVLSSASQYLHVPGSAIFALSNSEQRFPSASAWNIRKVDHSLGPASLALCLLGGPLVG